MQVKLKQDSESDVEIDIESDSGDEKPKVNCPIEVNIKAKSPTPPPIVVKFEKKIDIDIKSENTVHSPDTYQTKNTGNTELDMLLTNTATPTEPVKLCVQTITDVEKYFHTEFFEGRPTKTPERYMKIRGYILNAWNDNKPSYVSKTTVRSGLKHCGDVNCISRIHSLLEQMGAINFGHAGEHFDYIRPLAKLKEYFLQPTRNKQNCKSDNALYPGSMVLERKQRTKQTQSKEDNGVDANYTVSHINGVTTVVIGSMAERESTNMLRSKVYTSNPELELIECMRFTKDRIAPFKVTISLSTLLCLQLHSLSSKNEVIGILGGFCTKSVGRNKLSITRYKPCNTSEQSRTMCEMCPSKFSI